MTIHFLSLHFIGQQVMLIHSIWQQVQTKHTKYHTTSSSYLDEFQAKVFWALISVASLEHCKKITKSVWHLITWILSHLFFGCFWSQAKVFWVLISVASLEHCNEVSAEFFCPVKMCFEFAREANFRWIKTVYLLPWWFGDKMCSKDYF